MAYGIHRFSEQLYISNWLKAASRASNAGDRSATTFLASASTTTYQASDVIDTTTMEGPIYTQVSAGDAGAATLDGKWVETNDLTVAWTAVPTPTTPSTTPSGGLPAQEAIVQIASTIPTTRFCEINNRSFTKRYAMFVVTLSGTRVFSTTIIGHKRSV